MPEVAALVQRHVPRTPDAKRRLYQAIVRSLERAAGVDPGRTLIVLHDLLPCAGP